jgi:hypothetical protein
MFGWYWQLRRRLSRPITGPTNKTVTLQTPPVPGPASAVLVGEPVAGRPGELDSLLELASKETQDADLLTVHLGDANVLALGRPAPSAIDAARAPESDLLHFTAVREGEEHTYLPVFTGADALRRALERNPDWQAQSVLEIHAGDLVKARDPDVTLVVDPWSSKSFEVPPLGMGDQAPVLRRG